MVVLVLSAALPLTPTGLHVSFDWTNAVSSQHIIFFVGLYMVAVGYGALNPCITSFGADQFDHTDEEERHRKSSFFNWRYFILNAASLISGTIIVWVQDREGWFWGSTIAALFVALGAGTFLLGCCV
jgi:solute carrier family 15 (peptide/histidine transporter), member 3/4